MSATSAARNALLISAAASFLSVGAGMAIFGPALPVLAKTFALTTAQSGWLVSTQWTGCLLGVVAMYFFSQKTGPLPLLLMMAGGMGLMAISPSWTLTLLGALIFGLGYGAVAAIYNPRILVAFGPRGPGMMSLINALFSTGAILAPFLFVLAGQDPRPVFGAIALASLGICLFAGRAGMIGLAPDAVGKGFHLHLPIIGLIIVAIGLEVSLSGLGPTALIHAGMSEDHAAWVLSEFFVAALAIRLALIAIANRVPSFALLTFAFLWAALCGLGAIYVSPDLFFPALGISVGLFFQGGYVTAARKMGDDPRVSPLILGVGLVGAVISPLVYSRLMDGFGTFGLFWLVTAVAGTAGAIALILYPSMNR